MKKQILAAGIICATLCAIAAKPKDPVLMKVGNDDVRLSEFEYLYNKNNTQQAQPQTIDEYVDMFVNFKLKVAAAEAAGLDTTKAFKDEYLKFRNELSEPYLRDEKVAAAQQAEAYDHMLSDLLVSHIMFPAQQSALADSLYAELKAGNARFEDVATKYSMDKASARRGGLMGVVGAGRYPWPFEKAAYETEVGRISPVINSGFGLHIIRVESRTPAKGQVHAAHILRMTRGASDSVVAAEMLVADSLYNVVTAAGADFAAVARQFSQDPGSARNGGDLGFFGPGMMVQEFDSVAFALADGEISRPFKTPFGWHIIKRIESKGPGTFEENLEAIRKQIEREPSRARLAGDAYAAAAVERFRGKLGGVTDSAEMTARALELAREELEAENADYRNLLHEYRDGILLFDISNREVWNKASADTVGLDEFFRANRAKYAWKAPKFKSLIIFAGNDSLLNEAMRYAADSIPATVPAQKIAEVMQQRFGRDVKVERVIAAKGENAITDYLGFGAEKPAKPASQRWQSYAAFRGRVIDQPEEASDVRGTVVADYQAALEKEWLERLHKEIPVKINQKVLKQAK